MKLAGYLGMLRDAEATLAAAFRRVADGHGEEPDVHFICHTLAEQCDRHEELLDPVVERYGAEQVDEPERLAAVGLSATRTGPLGLLRDLQDLHMLATMADLSWTLVQQAGAALRDQELLDVVSRCEGETATQISWLTTRSKQAAPQALVAAD